MKKILTTILLGASMLTAAAQNYTEQTFTYATGQEVVGFGARARDTFDVAMLLDGPSFQGMEITKITAYINSIDGITDTKLWMSSKLQLQGKNNAPDIMEQAVAAVPGSYEGYEAGELTYNLPEPYMLTGAPVYIGYSMTVTKTSTDRQMYPIVGTTNINPKGMFVHAPTMQPTWAEFTNVLGGVAAIVVTLRYNDAEYNLSIIDSEDVYLEKSEGFNLNLVVSNRGKKPVGSFVYAYSYEDDGLEGVTEGVYSFPVPLQPNVSGRTKVILPIEAVEGVGTHKLSVSILSIDGQPNGATTLSADVDVTIVPFIARRRPLIEEYTGLWCGTCLKGYIAMQEIEKRYGEGQVSVSFHNNDAMTVTDTYPMVITSVPSTSINRDKMMDPYYGDHGNVDFGISLDVENAMEGIAIADITLEAKKIDGNKIDARALAKFVKDFDAHDYRIGYILTGSGLSNPMWVQINNFAGQGAVLAGTLLAPLATWGFNVRNLVFDDVALDVEGMDGYPNSVPAHINVGEEYEWCRTFALDKLPLQAPDDKYTVVAFVVDAKTGKVVNAQKKELFERSGVDGVEADGETVAVEYYDLTGRRLNAPAEGGISIERRVRRDGTSTSRKIMR